LCCDASRQASVPVIPAENNSRRESAAQIHFSKTFNLNCIIFRTFHCCVGFRGIPPEAHTHPRQDTHGKERKKKKKKAILGEPKGSW
jgi:hypothetical protein